MIRYACLALALMAAAEARAADQAPADAPLADAQAAAPAEAPALPPAEQPSAPADAPPPGTPTSATATVSPATVAEAVSRIDDGSQQGAGADEVHFGLSLGTSLAGGSFGSGQSSRLSSTAFGARVAFGSLRLTASIPYLSIRSRGVIFSGIDSTPVIAAASTGGPRVTADGLGDLTVGAAYSVVTNGGPEIEFAGRVKLPTARDSDQLSTNKTDFSVGIQATQVVGNLAPFVSATYRFFGDPAVIDLRDGLALSAGTAVMASQTTTLLFSYHYAKAATRLVNDSHELFAGASSRISDTNFRLTGFVTAGLSHGAASQSAGLSLAVDF